MGSGPVRSETCRVIHTRFPGVTDRFVERDGPALATLQESRRDATRGKFEGKMPANKTGHPLAHKEKPTNGLCSGKKKKHSCVKHKKHCKQYLQLHSEYRSTYTWHDYTGPQQEHTVVRRAPQPPPTSNKQASAKLQSAKSTEDENTEGPTLEPPLPRRKKCPELAYKTHEFITAADAGGIDAVDSNVVADKELTSNLPPSQLSKAISRISTEYRLQFAWPRRAQLTNGETVSAVTGIAGDVPGVPVGTVSGTGVTGPPRKSLSMGALKQGIAPAGPAPVHKKRGGDVDHKRDGVQPSELEPLVGGTGTDAIDGTVSEAEEREEDTGDSRVPFRGKRSGGRTVRISEGDEKGRTQEIPFPTSEVIELRRLADGYKHRDWGSGLAAEDKASIWNRVSSNNALNALSLARSVTKEEKDKENTKKVVPPANVPAAGRPSSVQARFISGIAVQDEKTDAERAIARARKDFLIRHHLDRTTGIGDGALLPSPTREKLEPVIPRRREETKEREEIQPRMKSSPKNSPRTGRSQSLGPSVTERRSPKRHPPRAPSLTKDAKEKEKEKEKDKDKEKELKEKEKDHKEKGGEAEKHVRPTEDQALNGDVTGTTEGDLSTASTPPSHASQISQIPQPSGPATASPWIDDEPVVKSPPEPTRVKSPEQMIMRSPEPVNWTVPLDTGKTFTVTQNVREEPLTRPHSEAKSWAPSSVPSAPQSAPPELAAQHKSQHSQHSGYKSPESESVSFGSYGGLNGHKDGDSERGSPLPSTVRDYETAPHDKESPREEKDIKEEKLESKPVAGTTLRRLDDPAFEERKKDPGQPVTTVSPTMTTSASQEGYRVLEGDVVDPEGKTAGTGGVTSGAGYHVLEAPPITPPAGVPGSVQQRSAASDVLEKARNRFDKFWGKGGATEN